jgi:predicted esterase
VAGYTNAPPAVLANPFCYDNLKTGPVKVKIWLKSAASLLDPMIPENIRNLSFTARLDCHYLLSEPEAVDHQTLLVVTLHGFSSNPEVMLRLTANMLGPAHVVASVEGPSQFYLGQNLKDVGYSWATHKHSDSCVRLHHDMLLHILDEAGREYGIPPARRILAGFSQPVGMNYRFAATHPSEVRGVIGICGGVPRNWEDGPYQKVAAALLHIARREDEFYKPEATERFAERLRVRADDVEFHMLEGGHRFPSKAKPIVDQWLARIIPDP